MKAKIVKLLMLSAVCTVALWPPAISLAWDQCLGQSCPFWRNVCEIGGGTFDQQVDPVYERCVEENESIVVQYYSVCTYPDRAPWSIRCTGI